MYVRLYAHQHRSLHFFASKFSFSVCEVDPESLSRDERQIHSVLGFSGMVQLLLMTIQLLICLTSSLDILLPVLNARPLNVTVSSLNVIMTDSSDTDHKNDLSVEEVLEILKFVTFVSSLVISPLLLIYFARTYCCARKQALHSSDDEILAGSSFQSQAKKMRNLMEDHFNNVAVENSLLSRSAASSMDHGYLAEYIRCDDFKQQSS